MHRGRKFLLRSAVSRLLTAMVVSALFASSTWATNAAMSVGDKKYQDTQNNLKQLRQQITDITKNLNQSRNEQQELTKTLRSTELEMGKLAKQKHTLDTSINALSERLNSLNAQKIQLQQDEHHQKTLISQQLTQFWHLHRQPDIKVILNQQSPDTLSRLLTYAKYLQTARLELLANHKKTSEMLATLEQNILNESEQLKKDRDTHASLHESLARENEQRKITLSSLDSTIASQDQRLKLLIRDRNALEQLLKSVEEAITTLKPERTANQHSFASRKGKMLWPAKGKIRQKFGAQRDTSQLNWDGLVINAALGSPVNVIHQGRIVFSDWFRGMGLLVIVDHGDGYLSLYAHNQSLLRETGEWVQAGDTIATVGNSGGQANNGLYFEIRHKGQPVNPTLWCK